MRMQTVAILILYLNSCFPFSAKAQHLGVILIATCPSVEKQKCKDTADRQMKGANAAWCITDGVNNCKDKIMDDAAICLDSCGDTRAFDRLDTIRSHGNDAIGNH